MANRRYKKKAPFRSQQQLVVVAEGQRRERQYFEALRDKLDGRRVKLLWVEHLQDGESTPKHFLERFEAAKEQYDLDGQDPVYYICDLDKFDRHIIDLHNELKNKENQHLLVSNPCFEVWLLAHVTDTKTALGSCQKLKRHLEKKGQKHIQDFIPHLEYATKNARKNHNSSQELIPEAGETLLYYLGEALEKIFMKNRSQE